MCVYYNDRVALELMDLIRGQDVLLVGCEDGYVLSTLALSGHTVVALDFDLSNISKCQKLLRGWSQISIVRLEGRSFPFDDESFDTTLVSLFAHHASNPLRVFQEVFRVLRPEGTVVLADLVKHEETWMMDKLSDVWLGFTEDEIGSWLTEAGFQNVEARPSEERCSGEVFEEHNAKVDILVITATKPRTM
jgi:ubiquinone/menaquinone biosynthesis C-methylase UbiE